jgi:nitrite reductase (NADH) large subunit
MSVEQEKSMKKRIVVVGNGMVGHNFVEKLVESGAHEHYDIVVFGEEPRPAYDRVYLSSYFSGKTAEDLSLVEPGFYEKHGITLHLKDKVVAIDRRHKTVTSESGLVEHYDRLVLATGSYPFVPPIEGNDREGCLVYRTIEDLEEIKAAAEKGKVGVVVGGGLLGLEAAKALSDLNLKTHVVEFAPRLMPVQLDEGGAGLLKRKIEKLGVSVHTSKATQKIVAGEACLNRMEFADGEALETDIVLFSAGIRPRDELAKQAGLKIGPRGGIVINDYCQTSDPAIYAIGECALHDGTIYGLVAPGYAMAQAVALQLQGVTATFEGADMSTKLKLMGVEVGSIGDPHGVDEDALSYVYENGPEEIYKKIVVSSDGKKLLGAVLVGDSEDFGNLLQLKLNDMELPEHPDQLILPNRGGDGGGNLFGPDALPETAQLCSCYDVSKGDVVQAIDEGAQTLADIKAVTQACTGCGGCTQLVTSVVNFELEKRGVEVSKDICEHFPHSRQELYHICQVEEIKTFGDLIREHGQGHGCDICKQAVGSILSSLWNRYALEKDMIPLQDTNDNYLGNMQKDGTYSVIPRVPGGEITPDKLIVLGEVAKKYRLYTKVNGGQRIVLFGARMNDLPAIWEELINTGFESGQAYAKALRTVKSCVGSTWCRFGLDDSVTMAIEMENRYKGLRSPHKIKMGVSGCTRECAEAQAKDIGLISTENGWNLYVCGNGGMKPRHADLFATDLTKEQVFTYVDRLLMFYIKTADRMQRTATWMENLEGGLDYLREVVIEDSLGIAEQLESQMAYIRSTYECDWKRAVENDEYRKRFHSFVNVNEPASQYFVEERGQVRPATETERLEGIAIEVKELLA